MMLSRVGMAVTSVLNNSQLLRHTAPRYRGRVFATMEALRNAVMIVSDGPSALRRSTLRPVILVWWRGDWAP